MRLLGNRLLLRRIEPTKQKSSIILPGTYVEPVFLGEVIKTGPGFMTNDGRLNPTACKPGDVIHFLSTSGWHIKVNNETLTILNERDVLCILDPEEQDKSLLDDPKE